MKKKIIIGAAAAVTLAAAVVLGAFVRTGGDESELEIMRTVALQKGDLSQAVSATGTVYSAQVTDVYSNLSYSVKSVHVSVGDKVQEGDLLAELDTSSLQSSIAQKRASLSSSQAKAQQSLTEAQKNLDNFQSNLEKDYDTDLLKAQNAVETAQFSLESAARSLSNARYKLHKHKENHEVTDTDEEDAYDSTTRDLSDAVIQAEIDYEKAKASVEQAEKDLEIAQAATGESISTYEDKVTSAQLNTDFNDQWLSIQDLEVDLAKAAITAPVSGTVTAVQATEGASGSGLLFVIQNDENLKIIANISEYDIASVAVGDKVTIKTDATGDAVFEGTLSKIAPTSTSSVTGETDSSTDAEFESEITVASQGGGLRIGMNARLSIITEENTGVYSVPYEAVGQSPQGDSVIYIAKRQEDGTFIAEMLPVTTGLETDLYIEISGDGLADGLLVLRDITGITPGTQVNVQAEQGEGDDSAERSANSGAGGGMTPGGGGGGGGGGMGIRIGG